MSPKPRDIEKEITDALTAGDPVRLDFGRGERLHIDRPLPFLVVYVARKFEPAAFEVVTANSSYLLARSLRTATSIIRLVSEIMSKRFGAFIILDIGEQERDLLASDADHLPPFELKLSASDDLSTQSALIAFAASVEQAKTRYRAPQIDRLPLPKDPFAKLAKALPGQSVLTLRFAPIYRVAESDAVYPELKDRLVAHFVDAGLCAIAKFTEVTGSMAITSHRALGRRAFIDVVTRADRAMDEIAESFDFLLAVTPINAQAAWKDFASGACERAPRFLYRPLAIDVARQKKALYSINLDQFEDPVLTALYSEKRQELDVQLSLLAARETPRYVEFGRALYGPVEPSLIKSALDILNEVPLRAGKGSSGKAVADVTFLERRARAMIKSYAGEYDGFSASVEVRDDLPSGLMVSGGCLLISSATKMDRNRVEAILSHEVGVHLLTYFNGSAQGLRLFRSGLAGYEGAQEGLAVLAEYLVGGMTLARLKLIAARVLACADMLDGASFVECHRRLVREFGFADTTAFNIALRVYRGGGLPKDAVYLRGLLEILSHLRAHGSLDPFWMGKIAVSHFGVMQELGTRGLLKPPRLLPQFLSHSGAAERLSAARAGIEPIQLVN